MISWDKIEDLKIPVGFSRKYVLNPPFVFFSGKNHFFEIEGGNQSGGEGTTKKKNIKKCQEFIKILTLYNLKSFINC